MEDGDIAIDYRDLGLSGSLGEDKRPGLNNFIIQELYPESISDIMIRKNL
jgi:hypothetical protein